MSVTSFFCNVNGHSIFLSLAMDLFFYSESVHSHYLILTCSCSRVKELFIFLYNLCYLFFYKVVDQHAKVLIESVDS